MSSSPWLRPASNGSRPCGSSRRCGRWPISLELRDRTYLPVLIPQPSTTNPHQDRRYKMAESNEMRPRGGVLTISDACSRGEREDTSGIALRELLATAAEVVDTRVIPDDRHTIETTLREMAEKGLDLV